MNVDEEIEKIVKLGDKLEGNMKKLDYMIKAEELRAHLEELFQGIKKNLENIRMIKKELGNDETR